MKTVPSPRPALLALPLLLASAHAPDSVRIAFAPAAGSSLSKTCSNRMQFALDDVSVSLNGSEFDSSMMGNPEIELTHALTVEFEDEYRETSAGRPGVLKRSFAKLEANSTVSFASEDESGEEELTTESELAGQSVLFTWNADEQRYDCSFEGEGGDESLLENLHEDVDLREFLPSTAVEPGASWDVDPKALVWLLAPGGDLKLRPADGSADSEEVAEMFDELDLNLDTMLADLFQGEIKASFTQILDEGDVRLAEIVIEAELDSSNDYSELLWKVADFASEGEAAEAGVSIDDATLSLGFEGKGVLLWNLDAGHAQRFEMNGDADLSIDIAASGEEGGESQSISITAEASGTIAIEMNFGT